MSDRTRPVVDGERNPPLARDLAGVEVAYRWRDNPVAGGNAVPETAAAPPAPEDELLHLRAQVQQLTAALEDVVTLALSGTDYKERAIMMHRRAVAALSGSSVRPPDAARG